VRHGIQTTETQGNAGESGAHGSVLFLVSFLAGSAFMLAGRRAESEWHMSWPGVVALALGIEAVFAVFVVAKTRDGTWDEPRRFALMAGAFLVYAWIGFLTDISLHGTADLVGHSIIAAILCARTSGDRCARGEAVRGREKSVELRLQALLHNFRSLRLAADVTRV
jgi:hypothetical protein